MEYRLGTILIESALKSASLSEAVDIFVIVDTPTGRLCSGNGALLESFLTSTLTPSSRDLRVFVDAFHPPPQIMPLALCQPAMVPPSLASDVSTAPHPFPTENFPTLTSRRKRHANDITDDTVSPSKSRKSVDQFPTSLPNGNKADRHKSRAYIDKTTTIMITAITTPNQNDINDDNN